MRAALCTLGVLVFSVGSGCGSTPSARQKAQLGSLVFDVPAGWQHADSHRRGATTTIWTRSDDDDGRKESVTVIRSELSPAVAKAGVPALVRLLAIAQGSLVDARIGAVVPVTTAQGFAGARVEVDYRPPGLATHYHRVHVVLVDGVALVHVMYTAKTPDDELDALALVLGSLRHGEVQS